jgi:hypothetical protein
MSQDLTEPADRPDGASPATSRRPRRRVSARVGALAGLSTAVMMAVVGLAAGPAAAQTGSFSDCINEAITRISAQAGALPADQRAAYIQREVDAARVRCGALVTTTPTTPTTTTTTPTTTTTTTPPTTTTTPPPGSTYDVVDTEPVVSGQERTLEATCRPGDRLVRYTYDVPSATGSNTSRSVNASSSGTGARVTFRVVGTVTSPTATLTVTCRAAA